MSDIKQCPNCGYKCHENQLQKTKGYCPRCHPKQTSAYLQRIRSWQERAIVPVTKEVV